MVWLNRIKECDLLENTSVNVNLYIDYENEEFIKIYKDDFSKDLVERNINFLRGLDFLNPKIISSFYDKSGQFIGYSQKLVKEAKTFKDGLTDEEISFEQKYKFICDIFRHLRNLHNSGCFIGDIHLRNLLYDGENGYIIDLDDIRFSAEDNLPLSEYYYINYEGDVEESSIFTDNIKTTISALSLLYGFDFEEIVMMNSLNVFFSYLELFIGDSNLLNDIKNIFYNKEKVFYFDEVLKKHFSDKVLIKEEV